MALKSNKFIFILSFIGFCILCTGAGLIYVEQGTSILSIGLVAVGLIGFVLHMIYLNRYMQRFREKFHLGRIIILSILTSVFIAVFFLANYWAHQSDLRWDLTRYKQHTLSDVTIDILEDLNLPINMTALVVGAPPKYLDDLLNEYRRRAGGLVTIEVVDPLVNLGYAAQFGNVISGNEKKLIVETTGEGARREDIDFTKDPLGEEHINNALMRVLRPAQHIYFLKGHNEYALDDEGNTGLSMFDQVLVNNNILTHSLILGDSGQIPEDCSLLIIAGPKQHLSEKEELTIHEYMKGGGDVLFLIEHTVITTPEKPLTDEEKELNPDLNRILNKWGLKILPDIVVDIKSFIGQDVGVPATNNYLTHRAIVSNLDYTFYVRPRSITATRHKRETIKLVPLVLTASPFPQSWGESNRMLEVKYNEREDKKGPVPIAYVGFEPRDETKASDTRFLVFTDADFLTNAYISQFSNAQMGLNAVSWLMELDYQAYPDIKKVEVEPLELTSTEKRMIIAMLTFIPLMILFLGFSVWLKTVTVRS